MKLRAFSILIFLEITSAAFGRDPLDKPNVIVIYLDDSGYGDFSHNGNPTIETPHISRLAAGGANFSQFYVTSSACSASRYSLLTGRYPGRSGLGSWVIGPESPRYLQPREVTLADGLKKAGYHTAMAGKWHLGNPNEKNSMSPACLPLAHGFDSWIGTNVSHDYADAKLLQSDPAGNHPIKGYRELARDLPLHPDVCESLTGRYATAAVDFIKASKDAPFFLYLAHNMPHLGIHASSGFQGKSRRGLLGDVMAEVDDSVGRILAALKEAGIDRNTLIVFSSDNGPWIKFEDAADDPNYGEARLHVGYAQPFRDGKGSTWEGGYRVPGIFYWPGVIEPNRQLEPASTLDVLPTVFALAHAETPQDRSLDGRDIRPLLAPQRFPGKVADFVLLENYSNNKPSAIRKGPWKLMIRQGSQTDHTYGFHASETAPLLFNVEQDFSERIDRAAEQPEIAAELLAGLRRMREQIENEGVISDR